MRAALLLLPSIAIAIAIAIGFVASELPLLVGLPSRVISYGALLLATVHRLAQPPQIGSAQHGSLGVSKWQTVDDIAADHPGSLSG